jgi:hypothetical protein
MGGFAGGGVRKLLTGDMCGGIRCPHWVPIGHGRAYYPVITENRLAMMTVGKINWWGKKPESQQTTTEPEPVDPQIALRMGTKRAGQGINDLWRTLRGQTPRPQRVCEYGDPVLPGNTICTKGHYVG